MSIKYCKGFYTAGIVAFTLQCLVYLFNLVIGDFSFVDFIYVNWAAILGYVIMMIMYLKKERTSTDLILIVIALILWGVRIWRAFVTSEGQIAIAFLLSALAIVGVIFAAIGLAGDIKEDKNKNKNGKV